MNLSVWVAFINSLKAVPELKSEDAPSPSLGGALKDAFVKPMKEGVAAMNLKKAYQEYLSWNDGNKGQLHLPVSDQASFLQSNSSRQTSYILI